MAWRLLMLRIEELASSVSTLNRQPWTGDKGCPLAWGLGVGLTTLSMKNKRVVNCYIESHTWMYSLIK
jgi:hypothetical protein